MTQYRARGAEIVDDSGRQLAVVVASNCSKKFAGELAKVAAAEANRLLAEREGKKPVRKAVAVKVATASRRKVSVAAVHTCLERDMGGKFECPAGNCCRPGSCTRDAEDESVHRYPKSK